MNLLAVYGKYIKALAIWFSAFTACIYLLTDEFIPRSTFPFLIEVSLGHYNLYLWILLGCICWFTLNSFSMLSEKAGELQKGHYAYGHALSRYYSKEQEKADTRRLRRVAVSGILWGHTIPRSLLTYGSIHSLALIFTDFWLGAIVGLGSLALSFVVSTVSDQRRFILRPTVLLEKPEVEKRNRQEQEEAGKYMKQQEKRSEGLPKASPDTALGLLFPFLEKYMPAIEKYTEKLYERLENQRLKSHNSDDRKKEDRPY